VQLGLERVGLARELTDAGDELARDTHASVGGQPLERAGDPVELDVAVERALGQA
jgi:hypothetical protein